MSRTFKKGQPVQWVSQSNSTSLLMDLGWVEKDNVKRHTLKGGKTWFDADSLAQEIQA